MKIFEYFLAGAFAALGALLLEIILKALFPQFSVLEWELLTLAVFVIVEELAKFVVIRAKVNFISPLCVISSSCFWIGLGFGLFEFGILLSNKPQLYSENVLPIMAIVVIHIVTTLLIGLSLAKLKLTGYSSILAILPALTIHMAFNYWVLTILN